MIVYLFLVLAFSNLVEYVLTPPRVFFSLINNPKNPESVVNLEILP
jgi:hypothetical protein